MLIPRPRNAPLVFLLSWLGFCAGWTIGSVPLTLSGAPFAALWIAFGCALGGVWLALHAYDVLADVLFAPPQKPTVALPFARSYVLVVLGSGAAITGAAAFFVPTNDGRLLWAACLIAASLALLLNRDVPGGEDSCLRLHEGPRWPWVAFLGAILWLCYVLILRHDADDAFYLNLPMGIVSSQQGMLVRDTMYGAADWPLLGSNYRVESLQTLIAAMAWSSGLPVVYVAHLVLPAIWCFAWAATLALIGTGIFGRFWWVFAGFAVLSSLVFAGSLQSWGVHGVGRLFHGKAPLILIVIPLIYVLVCRMESRRTPLSSAVALLSGLICVAVGLTANAIYVASLALGLSVFAAWAARSFSEPARLWLVLAVWPALLTGLWLMFFDTPVTVPEDAGRTFRHLGLWNMFPDKLLLGLMALSTTAAATAAFAGPSGRFVSAVLLGVCLFVINPVLWPLYDDLVTGGLNFRLWWAIPFPFFFALLLSWAILRVPHPLWLAVPALCVLAVLSLTPSGLLGMADTEIRPALIKRPAGLPDIQGRVKAQADGQTVLAAEAVSAWLPTFPGYPPQVYVRRIYLDQNETVVDADQLTSRRVLAHWINRHTDIPINDVIAAFEHQCPAVLVFAASAPPDAFDTVAGLYRAELRDEVQGYRIYHLNAVCG